MPTMARIVRHFACLLPAILFPIAAIAAPLRASGHAPQADAWGIVTSQAITVAGHEFCRYFIARWLDQPGSDHYTIAIHERPSARWGSQVWVEFGQSRVYQVQLPPARAELQALGESAAETVYQAILDIERQRRLIHDADLAPDEF
jgi:curli production assembly/transport component CsgE